MTNKKDMLLFMTDQHTPYYSGFYGNNVDTPNLDKLCNEGTRFDEAYTACPLCVPARMSFLSGFYASNTGVFTNVDTIADITPTFLHHLAAEGYETVLAGRMHFVGKEQRHGFTKRIAPDMTPVTWNRPTSKLREERGVFAKTFAGSNATAVAGGGESPVLHYDGMVLEQALEYMKQPHDKPQCIFVSLYAPHFPYVAPKELFEKYRTKVVLPDNFYDVPEWHNPLLNRKQQKDISEEKALGCIAAYCGMIENMDKQMGIIREAFEAFTRIRGTEGVFCYLSDHGDQAGDRRMLGKETYYEKSVKIPVIFAGAGICKNKKVKDVINIIDIGPTLLVLAEAEPMQGINGKVFTSYLQQESYTEERYSISEYVEIFNAKYCYSAMVKKNKWKFITYHGFEDKDMLFDTEHDPLEHRNLISEYAEVAGALREYLLKTEGRNPEEVEKQQEYHKYRTELFQKIEQLNEVAETERWQGNPKSARNYPEIKI